ncbi:MAG: hypothetical protein FJ291_19975 [Planctomycetes bacterium]|nr:hypothetical protein [Planctomycetota bacterium]
MPSHQVKCPKCGNEFSDDRKWGPKDWALYLAAVVPIGLMALVIAAVGIQLLLQFLGLVGK